MKDIIVTLPSTIDWEEYKKELEEVKDWKSVMNFKVPFLPKYDIDRCYIVYKGKIIGWMSVVGLLDNNTFNCSTTGKRWSGKFIQRSGPFHYLDEPIEHKGFQGWRYYNRET